MQVASHTKQIYVAVFGKVNSGKSSLINALAGHAATDASPCPGTTAETLYIPAEVLPLGRSVFIDTIGFPDGGKIGDRWLNMVNRVLAQADVILLVLDATSPEMTSFEYRLLATIAPREIPVITVLNKADLVNEAAVERRIESSPYPSIAVSATKGTGVADLRLLLKEIKPDLGPEKLVSDLVKAGDIAMMVVPSEPQAPKAQLNAFHSQLLREMLDAGCLPMVVRENELPLAITALTRPPSLVVADTTNFDRVMRLVPPDIPLTSVAILAARQKGNLGEFIVGVRAVARLRPGDKVLVAEGCSHRPLFEEVGNSRIPMLLKSLVGGPLRIKQVRGDEFPDSVRGYQLVVHCGACILSRREMLRRQAMGTRDGVPVINYGLLTTYMNHSLPRALSPLRRNGALGPEYDDIIEAENSPTDRKNGGRAPVSQQE